MTPDTACPAADAAAALCHCLQALLDWHQLAYLIFSAAAPLTARGASMLLALLLATPQSTLGWVPLECLMASGMPGRGTAASSIVSSIYPGAGGNLIPICLIFRFFSSCKGSTEAENNLGPADHVGAS